MSKSLALKCLTAAAFAFMVGAVWGREFAQKKSTYVDAIYGFSIEPPAYKKAPFGTSITPAMFTGPGIGANAANVNITITNASVTREEHIEKTLRNFEQLKYKLHSKEELEVGGRPAVLWDYSAALRTQDARGQETTVDLRFLVLAVIDRDRIVLLTCSAGKDAFQDLRKTYGDCIASFKLE